VPKGAAVYMMPVAFEGLEDITIDINGAIVATANWQEWPHDAAGEKHGFSGSK
jgi:hypothetical protein